jgi:hypothetical protein
VTRMSGAWTAPESSVVGLPFVLAASASAQREEEEEGSGTTPCRSTLVGSLVSFPGGRWAF